MCSCCSWCKTENVDLTVPAFAQRKTMSCGVIMITKKDSMVLTVQVYNSFIGFPKGHPEDADNNDPKKTAIREFYEETGIKLTLEQLTESNEIYIYHSSIFFMVYVDEKATPTFQEGFDVSACGWMHMKCLRKHLHLASTHVKHFMSAMEHPSHYLMCRHEARIFPRRTYNLSLDMYDNLRFVAESAQSKWWTLV